MIDGLIGFFFLLMNAGGLEQRQQAAQPVRVMTIEQRMIVRVPVRPRLVPIVGWEEGKGPKCLPVRAIAGAFLAGSDEIDFLLRNKQRVRARLENDCSGLDFYGGLYLQPEGAMLCAGRDAIRSRVGGICRISKFKSLKPILAKGD
jgi:hypothetical protein